MTPVLLKKRLNHMSECENENCWRDVSDMCNQCKEIEAFPMKAQALIKSLEEEVEELRITDLGIIDDQSTRIKSLEVQLETPYSEENAKKLYAQWESDSKDKLVLVDELVDFAKNSMMYCTTPDELKFFDLIDRIKDES